MSTRPWLVKPESLSFPIQVLLLSMRDMNIAKLTSVDVPLFNAIVQDLFPSIELPIIDYGKVFVLYTLPDLMCECGARTRTLGFQALFCPSLGCDFLQDS